MIWFAAKYGITFQRCNTWKRLINTVLICLRDCVKYGILALCLKLSSKLDFEPCRSNPADLSTSLELTVNSSACSVIGGGRFCARKKRLYQETETFQQMNPVIDLLHVTAPCFACLCAVSGNDELNR